MSRGDKGLWRASTRPALPLESVGPVGVDCHVPVGASVMTDTGGQRLGSQTHQGPSFSLPKACDWRTDGWGAVRTAGTTAPGPPSGPRPRQPGPLPRQPHFPGLARGRVSTRASEAGAGRSSSGGDPAIGDDRAGGDESTGAVQTARCSEVTAHPLRRLCARGFVKPQPWGWGGGWILFCWFECLYSVRNQQLCLAGAAQGLSTDL